MDLCVDLETGGTSSSSAVLAVALQAFEPLDIEAPWPEPFVCAIEPVENDKYQRTWSGSTIQWWSTKPQALETLGELNVLSLKAMANTFVDYVINHKVEAIWANSPSFDVAILRHLFDQLSIRFPFVYWQERDVRTLKALLPVKLQPVFQGLPHHPLHDVQHEVRIVQTFLANCRVNI